MLGSVTRQKVCQPRGAERQRGFLLARALLLHQRDQRARDEGERDEGGGQDQPRHGEDDADAGAVQRRAEPAVGAEQQHPHQAGNHRRYRERQFDQGDQQAAARETEAADAPGRGQAAHRVQRHADRGDEQRQLDRGNGVGRRASASAGCQPVRQRFGEHDDQRQQQQDDQQDDGQCDQPRPHGGALLRGRRIHAAQMHAPLQQVEQQQDGERHQQHHQTQRGGAGIVELLQADDDQQRRDLADHRHVAGDEDDRTVFADTACQRRTEAGQQGRHQRRQHDAAHVCARVAPSVAAASSASSGRSMMTGSSVRTTNGRPTKISATRMPSGV